MAAPPTPRRPARPGASGTNAADPPPAALSFVPLYARALKGRGTAWSIAHRFERDAREACDDGWGTLEAEACAPGSAPRTEFARERVVSIVAHNDSPDLGFDASINPYRGCEHGCVYCYARPTHGFLGLSPGLDFETRIVAKVNAAEKLRATLGARSYRPLPFNIGSVTDAYQPIERGLRLTRGVLEVLAETHHPFWIVTKSSLVERDLDLIAPMAARNLAAVVVSLTTLDAGLARILEPRAAAPQRRLRTIETLARAGVPVGVSVSPLIPFVNEPELERVLAAARGAGATSAFAIVLRLPWEVSPLFRQWLQTHFPERAARVMARVQEMRGGRDNDPRFGTRFVGEGVWASLLQQRIEKTCARLGYDDGRRELDSTQFRPPALDARQGRLF